MSNQPEVVNNSEQPFQVVTQKRYSSQSRRGMTRDKAPHSRSQSHSEDSSRKRHTPQHHHLKHERESRDSRPRQIPRSSHSHSTQRGDSTRGGGREGEGHRHRANSWETEQKGSSGSLEKITSPNRFERLSTAEISNRFQRLNPDTEAPGDPKGGERKTHGHPSRSSVGSRGSRKSSKEEEHEDMLEGDKTEKAKDSPEPPANSLEEEAVNHEDQVEEKGGSVETEKEAKLGGKRFSYSREELFSYKNHPLSLLRPKALKEEYFRGGKWCAEAWLTPPADRQDTELPEESKVKHPATLALLREHDPKHLSKVSLSPQRRSFGSGCSWKEMSSSGTSSTSAPPPSTPPPKQSNFLSEEREELFFEMEGPNVPPQSPTPRLPHPPNYSPFHGPPPSPHMPSPSSHPPPHPHTPRVIDHVPLRDREWDRRSWRERESNWRQDGYKQRGGGGIGGEGEDSEPEWMAFGPTDRNEVIELKGLEEHEREREARKQADQEPSPVELNENESREVERLKSDGEEEKEMEEEKEEREESEEREREWEESPKVSESSSGGVEEEVAEEGDGKAETLENEFILDGFDFSTGLSICQDLSADEEEDQQVKVKRASGPTELGTALMKALKIKDQQEENHVLGVDTRPANALTLDEIQARENIHTPLSHPGDQSAFNKLVAQLQFTGAIHQEEKSPAPIQRPPKLSPVHTLPQQNFPLPQPIRLPPERRGNNNGSFGYLLERELDFDEELPPTLPPPPSSFLPQQLPLPRGELLNRRGGGGVQGQFPLQAPDYDLLSPSSGLIRPVPHRPDPLQEKWMDVYPEKQVEPLRQLDPLYSSSSHRLAASGGGRLGSTNWAVEMERRRLQELRLMQRERLLSAQAAHHTTIPGNHQRPMVSKPSISLLPTAVMRHLHNAKQSELASRGSPIMANKLDQDLTTTTSPMHSSLSNMLNRSDMPSLETRDYPLPPAMVSARARAPPPNYTSLHHMMDPTLYPQFMSPLPHGMPAQHPYMH